jgi:hypothetical protein
MGSGVWVALSALLLSSRLYPLEWSARVRAEEWTLLIALVASLAFALACRDTRRSWGGLLGLSGLMLIATPVAATLCSPRGLFGTGERDPIVLGVDLGLLAFGLAFAAIAGRLLIAKRLPAGVSRGERRGVDEGSQVPDLLET